MTDSFLLFEADDYYPSGGAMDFVSAHETIDEAKAAAGEARPHGWSHIASFDGEALVVVCDRSSSSPGGVGVTRVVEWQEGSWRERRS